ncbi:hypothetical protein [Microbacterium sp. No. 7]|uniref:hypothetical protein n=1 Tax=Microbacterium sp. No. 7 TaxID=1714373 RepID=UPI0006ED3FF9|nr:hypothetical protein [Microbacterium sp. No. 7]ALJ19534.1 hypothetical protein AOA12_06270 [Microbacterium sp. No. 7]
MNRTVTALLIIAAALVVPALIVGTFNGFSLLGALAAGGAIALTIYGAPSATKE